MKPQNAKESRVTARIPVELKKRLAHIHQLSGIAESDLVNLTMEALCRYVERYGQLTTPFEIIPRSKMPPSSFPAKVKK
ncbi:MAG: hypothetical protein LBH01_03915 [Verrucomicrobiales bacterium]|jgi:hypothetical protein|nr:hypothetical protein [Verrucomicrobiales bacterium]